MGTKAARIKKMQKKIYREVRGGVCVQWNMEAWTDAVDCTRIIPKRVYCIWCADFVFISFSFFFTRANTNTHANPFLHYYSRPIFFSPCHKLRLYCFQCVKNIIFQCQLLMYLWTNDSKNGFEGLQDGELRLKNLVHILRLKKNFSPLYAPNSYTLTKATEIHVYGHMHGRAFVFVCIQRVNCVDCFHCRWL